VVLLHRIFGTAEQTAAARLRSGCTARFLRTRESSGAERDAPNAASCNQGVLAPNSWSGFAHTDSNNMSSLHRGSSRRSAQNSISHKANDIDVEKIIADAIKALSAASLLRWRSPPCLAAC